MPISFEEFCYNAQADLNAVAGENGNPLLNRQPTGLLDALMSSQNTMGTEIDQLYDKGDGQAAKVQLKYLQPDTIDDSVDTISDICDETGTPSAYIFDEVDLTLEVQSQTKLLTEDQMRTLCETGSEFRTKLIAQTMNSLVKRINRKLILPFYNGVGGLLNGAGAQGTEYNFLYRDGIIQIDPEGVIDMMRDLMDTGMNGSPIVVGGGNIKKYADLKGIACCNNFGSDPSRLDEFIFYYDNDIDPVVTGPSDGNPFFVFAPGAAQFLSKPYNKGQYRKVNDSFMYDTITDPISGLEFDIDLIYNECKPRGYKFQMSLRFDLWQMPLTLFQAGDQREAINYNWQFQALETTVEPS